MSSVIQLQESETHVYIYPSSSDDDKQLILQTYSSSSSSSSVEHDDSIKEILSNHRKILFDKALGEMLTRHFYLIQHEFLSSDRFEGWIYTYNRHRYKIIISYHSSCSCKKFQKNNVCKHFLFVLKRIFNIDLYSLDLRLSIMEYRRFTNIDLEYIFQGQIRRLCSIVPPSSQLNKKEQLLLTFKCQSIDYNDVCPICFERLLMKNRKLVTCFYSCGKSMHKDCMNEWKHIKGKSTNCPLCQAHWINASAAEKAVIDYYARRSYPIEKQKKYILCCLYTPPDYF
ncbi:unnamed protein product [Rotaria sordida]|uniref:SWIM-type domain-containing protein n=1 Tax=Rotaria sordida TaxID=392033 RepID=A0A815MG94_9BILA|nr:unnamed protein product [Rotaria sordida]CAF1442698.1 unnamed protein product [Rotaria sordida]CAF1636372.1 unnamed protein product [Rotaria sordida]